MLKGFVAKQIRKRGYEITRTGYSDKNSVTYRKILAQFKINHIIDVGANEGQFAQNMRRLGFDGDISSFEPLSNVFKKLSENSAGDNKWHVYNLALGDKDEQQEINVSKNTVSSSFLEMLPEHIKQEPDSVVVTKQEISLKRTDTIWKEYDFSPFEVLLKLDVQGYEKKVLDGAVESLKHIRIVQLEMALIPLYSGELLLPDMIRYMDSRGFKLYNLMAGFSNFETGQLFQVDGIFARADFMHN